MSEPIVADSTCLIGLERIGRLDILTSSFQSITVPPEVQREFGTPLPWLQIEAPSDHALVAALKMLVDDGEAEAIALASERKSRIILDDKQARAVAQRLGVAVIGTVGVLVKAKRSGIISALKPVLDALDRNDFFISEALKKEALKIVDE